MDASNNIITIVIVVLAILLYILFMLAIAAGVVLLIISQWKLFKASGNPGWAAIVPVYNFWVMTDIVFNKNVMWFIFFLIPFLNFVAYFGVLFGTAKAFGKGTGFGILSCFFPFVTFPILAFGKAQYVGKAF